MVRCLDESAVRKPGLFNIRSLQPFTYLGLLWWADVVHVQSSVGLLRCLHIVLAKLMGKKIILTLHSHRPRHRLEHWLTRAICRLPDTVVAVNDTIRAAVCPRAHVIPAYIVPGADEEAVAPDVLAWIGQVKGQGKRLVVSNAYKLIRFEGEDLYGLDLLIELFSDSAVRRGHALLFVVSNLAGCEAAYTHYQQLIAERGLGESIWLLHRAMPFAGLLKHCDVSVRATNTDGDALSIRESLSYGKRTLASDCVARPRGSELFKNRNLASLQATLLAAPAQHTAPDESFDGPIVNLYGKLS